MSGAPSLDPGALGAVSEPGRVSWSERDTLLYALGVGAGADELAYTTENSKGIDQQVVPSFAVIPATSIGLLRRLGDVDVRKVLHAGQSVLLHAPLAPAGALDVVYELTDLVDKGPGKHCFVTIGGRGTDAGSGELVVETAMALVLRGAGGFGGPAESAVPDDRVAIPDRAEDDRVEQATRGDQALLYRLCGDRNPLHSDPVRARAAGFDAPILHGLATYGFATRALVATLTGDTPEAFDATRLRRVSCRFSAPVLPGDVLTTRLWRLGDGRTAFRTEARSADAHSADAHSPDSEPRTVLDRGLAEIT